MGSCIREIAMKVNKTTFIFWAIALLFSILFWLAHWMGFRSYTSILAGVNSGEEWTNIAGFTYISLYLIWVAIVPILLIAGGLSWIADTIARYRSSEIYKG